MSRPDLSSPSSREALRASAEKAVAAYLARDFSRDAHDGCCSRSYASQRTAEQQAVAALLAEIERVEEENARLAWRLVPGHNVYELAEQPGTWVAHNGPDSIRNGEPLYRGASMNEAIDAARRSPSPREVTE